MNGCLAKLAAQQLPSQITKAKQTIEYDLEAVNRDIEKFKANPEFNNKKGLRTKLVEYVSFCNEHAKALNMKERRKKHDFCKLSTDDAPPRLELLL